MHASIARISVRQRFVEPPLTIRRADGSMDPEYAMVQLRFGFPPGDV